MDVTVEIYTNDGRCEEVQYPNVHDVDFLPSGVCRISLFDADGRESRVFYSPYVYVKVTVVKT